MKLATRCGRKLAAAWALAAFAFSICSAAPGITLPNGTFVPKDSFYLFLCIGNSAMSGRDTSPDLNTIPNQWKFRISPAKHDWLPAKEPTSQDAYNTESNPKGGPTIPMIRELGRLNPNVTVGIMQYSYSGWTEADHFAYLKDGYDSIVKYAKLVGPNVTIAGIVSMFNLVEVQNCGSASCIGDYSGSIKAMVAAFRNDLKTVDAALANVPYIHAGYPVMAGSGGSGNYLPTTPQAVAMIAEIAKIPGLVANSVVIPTDSCSICHTCNPLGFYSHYDSTGNHRWGKRAADTIACHNWFPASVPLNCATATVQNLSRMVATVSFTPRRVLFDGTNWSVFDNAGKSFSVYSPNGRSITGMSASLLKTQKLLPGVYFVRADVR